MLAHHSTETKISMQLSYSSVSRCLLCAVILGIVAFSLICSVNTIDYARQKRNVNTDGKTNSLKDGNSPSTEKASSRKETVPHANKDKQSSPDEATSKYHQRSSDVESEPHSSDPHDPHSAKQAAEAPLHGHNTSHHGGVHVASFKWADIGDMFSGCLFILVAGFMKVAFHHAHFLSRHVPESCVLVVLGVAVGGILFATGSLPYHSSDQLLVSVEGSTLPAFTPRFFFFILLPPIILEAAYSLYDRAFFNNLGTILLYAVIGTLFNTLAIGSALYLLNSIGAMGSEMMASRKHDLASLAHEMNAPDLRFTGTDVHAKGFEPNDTRVPMFSEEYSLKFTDSLVFSSLISAVDPVAVLAIFQEVGVNEDLYFLVFGESLLNDATTVVLYNSMVAIASLPEVNEVQIVLSVAAFFTVSLGGLLIGIIFGLLTALLTKTTEAVRVVEPLAVFGMAYMSYLSAELFHFSGIISIIGCGLVQAHYALKNISQKSHTTVKYFIKMLSATNDAIIFLYLGMVLVSDEHQWNTGFVLWTLFLCLIVRFLGVFVLTALANRFRLRKIDVREQFIMAYGGLRGAVGFSLVLMLDPSAIVPRHMFITTTLVMVIFTVFFQGGTIQLLVKLLDIKLADEGEESMCQEFTENVMTHLMAGVEEVIGEHGRFVIRETMERIDNNYFKRWFLSDKSYHKLTELYSKLALMEHYAHLYGPSLLVEKTPLLGDMEGIEGEGVGSDGSDDDGGHRRGTISGRRDSNSRHRHSGEDDDEKQPLRKKPSFRNVGHRLLDGIYFSKQLQQSRQQKRPFSDDPTLVTIISKDAVKFEKGADGEGGGAADGERRRSSVFGSLTSIRRRHQTMDTPRMTMRRALRQQSFIGKKFDPNAADEIDDIRQMLDERRRKARQIAQFATVSVTEEEEEAGAMEGGPAAEGERKKSLSESQPTSAPHIWRKAFDATTTQRRRHRTADDGDETCLRDSDLKRGVGHLLNRASMKHPSAKRATRNLIPPLSDARSGYDRRRNMSAEEARSSHEHEARVEPRGTSYDIEMDGGEVVTMRGSSADGASSGTSSARHTAPELGSRPMSTSSNLEYLPEEEEDESQA